MNSDSDVFLFVTSEYFNVAQVSRFHKKPKFQLMVEIDLGEFIHE